MQKNFEELKAVIASGNRAAMHEGFGTHFSKDASLEELSVVANKMIARCKVWTENWSEMLKGMEPDLQRIRTEKLEATAEKFVGYTDEQLAALFEAVKAKRGVAA